MAGSKQYGFVSSYESGTLLSAASASASSFRRPSAVRVAPLATGFSPTTRWPRLREQPDQAGRDQRLADTRVGAGDEDAAGRRRWRGGGHLSVKQ